MVIGRLHLGGREDQVWIDTMRVGVQDQVVDLADQPVNDKRKKIQPMTRAHIPGRNSGSRHRGVLHSLYLAPHRLIASHVLLWRNGFIGRPLLTVVGLVAQDKHKEALRGAYPIGDTGSKVLIEILSGDGSLAVMIVVDACDHTDALVGVGGEVR